MKRPEGYTTGRPTDYKPEYCQMLLEHCREGRSFDTFAAIVGVSRNTVRNWRESNPEFLVASEEGGVLLELWWENRLRESGSGVRRKEQYTEEVNGVTKTITVEKGNNNANSISFALRNHNPRKWRDTQHIESENKEVDRFASEQETRDFLISKGIDPDA